MDLHTPSPDIALRLWRRLLGLTLAHSLLATILVAFVYRTVNRQGYVPTDMIPIWIVYALWLFPIFTLRRKAAPLRTWRAESNAIGCGATFLPLIQLILVDVLSPLGDHGEALTVMIQGNALLLVWILISGVCLAMIELPFPGWLWTGLFTNTGIALVVLVVMGMLRGL